MKLNTKRTIFVSFAFFLILAFWQAYDTIMPITLTNKFGLSQFWSGVLMAADNVLALFLLPLFGTISDKTNSRLGKRTPFILFGTIAAVVSTLVLSFVDYFQYKLVKAEFGAQYDIIDALYKEAQASGNPDSIFAAQKALENLNAEVFQHVTLKNIPLLILFTVVLLLVLVSMSTFRSAAVALMPDITPKPLRSKGNAVVNLVGYIGGILALGMMMITKADGTYVMDYRGFFIALCAVMVGALVVHMVFVKENKWAEEAQAQGSEEEKPSETATQTGKLSRDEKISFFLLLASVIFWWMGYNAVATKFSVYSLNVLGRPSGIAMTIGTVAAIISFIPVGILSGKLGRKKTVIIGVAILLAAFTAFCFVTPATPYVLCIVLFSLAGIGWATININSFPMVVELASHGNVGKYTGYYYTASMFAQVITPMLSGLFMDEIHFKTLFPYSAICVGLSLVTMLFVKHGDVKAPIKAKEDLIEHLDIAD